MAYPNLISSQAQTLLGSLNVTPSGNNPYGSPTNFGTGFELNQTNQTVHAVYGTTGNITIPFQALVSDSNTQSAIAPVVNSANPIGTPGVALATPSSVVTGTSSSPATVTLNAAPASIASAPIRTQIINNLLNTETPAQNSNAITAANSANSQILSAITALGGISQQEFQTLAYSSGTSGFATVPVTNSQGVVIGSDVVNTGSLVTGGPATNSIQNAPVGSPATGITTNSVQASPNSVIGYANAPNASGGNSNQIVFSAGSAYMGPGEYVSSSGAPSYIANTVQYNQQANLGNVGPVVQSAVTGTTGSLSITSPVLGQSHS